MKKPVDEKTAIVPIPQTGHICKPTAIAFIDQYYAHRYDFKAIPLNKHNNPLDHVVIKNPVSIRALAKKSGSVQGELLEIAQVQTLLNMIAYETQVIDFSNDFNIFCKSVRDALDDGNLVFAAFAVSTDGVRRGLPTVQPDSDDRNEHAAVIYAYDNDMMHFTHWGKTWQSSFREFYEASMVLLPERAPEYYINVKNKNVHRYKYEMLDKENKGKKRKIIKTITPKEGSGFRGKLIIAQKPQNLLDFEKKRALWLAVDTQYPHRMVPYIPFRAYTIPQYTPKAVDLNYIAHVLLDGELGGTPLKGFDPVHLLIIFNHFMDWIEEKQKQSDPLSHIITQLVTAPTHKKEDFLHILRERVHILYAVEIQKQAIEKRFFDKLSYDEESFELGVALHQLAMTMIDVADHMRDVFFYGGFSGKPGHSVMYRLYQTQHVWYFCVYDPGNDVYYEQESQATGALEYYPVYAFSLPGGLHDEACASFLVALLKLQILPKINPQRFSYTEKNLYQLLHSAPIWFKGSIVSGSKVSHLTLPQQSGTCTWRAMECMLSGIISEKSHFHAFLLAHQWYCLEQARCEDAQKKGFSLHSRTLLKRSLARLAHHINQYRKMETSFLQSAMDINRLAVQLQHWKNALVTHHIRRNEHIVCADNPVPVGEPNVYHTILIMHHTISQASKMMQSPDPKILKGDFNATMLDHALDDLHVILSDMQVDIADKSRAIALFCFHFTDKQYVITLSKMPDSLDAQGALVQKIETLMFSYQRFFPRLTPETAVIYMSMLSILDRLGRDKILHGGETGLYGAAIHGQTIYNFLNRIAQNAHLTTLNPRLDVLWERLRTFYGTLPSKGRALDYYVSICAQAPEKEINVLKQYWITISRVHPESVELIQAVNKLFQDNTQIYFACLNVEERKKIKKRIPWVSAALALQEKIEKLSVFCLGQVAVYAKYKYLHTIPYPSGGIDLKKEYKRYPVSNECFVALTLHSVTLYDQAFFLRRTLLEPSEKDNNIFNQVLLSSFDVSIDNAQSIPYEKDLFQEDRITSRVEDAVHHASRDYPLLSFLSDEDYIKNLLHHVRINQTYQASILLETLYAHTDWLEDPAGQRYIFLSIFQPAVLLHACEYDSAIWPLLEKLWQQQKKCSHVKTWFIAKIALLIAHYIAESAEHRCIATLPSSFSTACATWAKRGIRLAMIRLRDKRIQEDTGRLREIHYCRLLAFLIDPINTPREQAFVDYIDAYCFLSLSPCQLSLREERHIEHILYTIQPWVQQNQQQIADSKQHYVQAWYLQNKNTSCDMHDVCFLPAFIRETPEFISVFGAMNLLVAKHCMKMDDRLATVYFFSYRGISYRIIAQGALGILVQKEHKKQGWYTYAAPSESVRAHLNFQYSAFSNTPRLLDQNDYRVWVRDNKHWMIVRESGSEIVYERSGRYTDFKLLDKQYDSKLVAILEKFESLEFISVMTSEQYHTIRLERYGLEFVVRNEEPVFTKDRRYRVLDGDINRWFGTGLLLHDDLMKKNMLLMPIQRYYKYENGRKTQDGTQYLWQHDLHHFIKQEILSTFDKESRFQAWTYTKSEVYAQFEITEDDTVIAHTVKDRLYLAYLYLAQDRPHKALTCLRETLLEGTFDEIEQLYWIAVHLPFGESDKIRNSRVVAVQLYALYLVLEATRNMPSWYDTRTRRQEDIVSNTSCYERLRAQVLKSFVETLSDTIQEHYATYSTLKVTLPVNMHIKIEHEKILLSYCVGAIKKNSQSNPSWDIGDALCQRYKYFFSEEEPQTFNRISKRNILVSKSINIDPSTWKNRYDNIDQQYAHCFKDFPNEARVKYMDAALEVLNPYMEESALVQYYPLYFRCALLKLDRKKLQRIKRFCKSIQGMYYDNEHGEPTRRSLFLLASEILWFALHVSFRSVQSLSDFQKIQDHREYMEALSRCATEYKEQIPTLRITLLAPESLTIESHFSKKEKSDQKKVVGRVQKNSIAYGMEFQDMPYFKKFFDGVYGIGFKHEKSIYEIMCNQAKNPLIDEESRLKKMDALVFHQMRHSENTYYDFVIKNDQQIAIIKKEIVLKKESLINDIEKTRYTMQSLIEKRSITLHALSREKTLPTLDRLLRSPEMLSRGDLRKTGMNDKDITLLYEHITHLLACHNHLKRLDILEEACISYAHTPDASTVKVLVRAFLSQTPVLNAHQAFFEYMNSLVLRPVQRHFLATLYENTEPYQEHGYSRAMALLMGEGKSKVILPLWAFETANGHNLTIIVVPEMSLGTNFHDLQRTSRHSFQQSVYCVRYHRDAPSDPASLQGWYEMLETIRSEKSYIVSTASTWQSLELKYIEILENISTTQADMRARQQLLWLGKILGLLRARGVVAIDEGHVVLDIKKELNYTIDSQNSMDMVYREISVQLFLWLYTHTQSIAPYLEDPSDIMLESTIHNMMRQYIHDFCQSIEHAVAPDWALGLCNNVVSSQDLENYLLQDTVEKKIELFFTKNTTLHRKWWMLRHQFQTLLSFTLRKKLYEDYGPSPAPQVAYAIPYRANNIPTQYVYGDPFIAMNCTIQMILIQGLSVEDMITVLKQWQKDAYEYHALDAERMSDAEKVYVTVFEPEQYLPLLALDLQDSIMMEALHRAKKQHPLLLRHVLMSAVSTILENSRILQSNAINFVDQFYRVAVISGTLNNYQTFHPRIHMLHPTRLGNNARVIACLTQNSRHALWCAKPHNMQEWIRELLSQEEKEGSLPRKVRAFIDYGGYLRGFSNLEAARFFARCCTLLTEVQYILFYQGDALFFLDNKTGRVQSLVSSNKDYLNKTLKCSALERFTYYDQEHTLGSDIDQDEMATGILTVDYWQGLCSSMLQAAMRMRGLDRQQTLVMVTNYAVPSINHMIIQLQNNEDNVLKADTVHAASKKIHNVFRNTLMKNMINASLDLQIKGFQEAKKFFITTYHAALQSTKKYNNISTETFLHNFYSENKKYIENITKRSLHGDIEKQVDNIIKITKSQHPVLASPGDFLLRMEVQQNIEKQSINQHQKETFTQYQNRHITLTKPDCSYIMRFFEEGTLSPFHFSSLSQAVSVQYPEYASCFSHNLFASSSWLYAYYGQNETYSAYMQPAFYILFFVNKKNDFSGILISHEEAGILPYYMRHAKNEHFHFLCMMSAEGNKYYDSSSDNDTVYAENIKTALEQFWLFTGNVLSLIKNDLSSSFLESFEKKISFLKKNALFFKVQEAHIEWLWRHKTIPLHNVFQKDENDILFDILFWLVSTLQEHQAETCIWHWETLQPWIIWAYEVHLSTQQLRQFLFSSDEDGHIRESFFHYNAQDIFACLKETFDKEEIRECLIRWTEVLPCLDACVGQRIQGAVVHAIIMQGVLLNYINHQDIKCVLYIAHAVKEKKLLILFQHWEQVRDWVALARTIWMAPKKIDALLFDIQKDQHASPVFLGIRAPLLRKYSIRYMGLECHEERLYANKLIVLVKKLKLDAAVLRILFFECIASRIPATDYKLIKWVLQSDLPQDILRKCFRRWFDIREKIVYAHAYLSHNNNIQKPEFKKPLSIHRDTFFVGHDRLFVQATLLPENVLRSPRDVLTYIVTSEAIDREQYRIHKQDN